MDYYRNNIVWDARCTIYDRFALWEISPQRLLAEDDPRPFDEDPEQAFDLSDERDDALIRDGSNTIIALCPAEYVIQEVIEPRLLFWQKKRLRVTPVEGVSVDIHSIFGRWITGSDSYAEWAAIGVSSEGATLETFKMWNKRIDQRFFHENMDSWNTMLDEFFVTYECLLYLQWGGVHCAMKVDMKQIETIGASLAAVAAHYGAVLPPDWLRFERKESATHESA